MWSSFERLPNEILPINRRLRFLQKVVELHHRRIRDRTELGRTGHAQEISPSTTGQPVDLRTLGGIADSLENRCHPRICSSNDEDSELDVPRDSGGVPRCSTSRE